MNKNKHDINREVSNNASRQTGNSDNNFPGYPHYPSSEDMMDSRNNNKRVSADMESLPGFHNSSNTPHRLVTPGNGREDRSTDPTLAEDDLDITMGTEADVTNEERQVLEDDMYLPTRDEDGLRQARLDDTDLDGEKLNEESLDSGSDLDINVEQDKTTNEAIGEEDEENEYWSLGNDDNDNIVEGTP